MPRNAETVAIAALLMSAVALSIDVMLPAMGAIAADLAIEDGNRRQWIIWSLMAGLALGQLAFGPLSDAIGRRPAIFWGCGLFVAGSLLCSAAPSFEAMLAGRIAQGAGAAGPRIVTVALLRDRFAGAELARVLSLIMTVFVMTPVLAPLLGQALLALMPWRALLALTPTLCVVGGVWLWARQPETLARRRPLSPGALLAAAAAVARDRRAVAYTFAGACCYGALMAYVGAAQQIFQEIFDVGAWFAALFGASATVIAAATAINARLVRRIAMARICQVAVVAATLWSAAFLGWATLAGGALSLAGFMTLNAGALFCFGLTFGNVNAIALERLAGVAGLAAALIASINTASSLAIAAAIAALLADDATPIVLGYALCALAALALMLFGDRAGRAARARSP